MIHIQLVAETGLQCIDVRSCSLNEKQHYKTRDKTTYRKLRRFVIDMLVVLPSCGMELYVFQGYFMMGNFISHNSTEFFFFF